ncbi:hypothetical protein P872_01645 [Rhodonellum psychrophilum GCM71 = DSM 17998]|uniref:Capsule synthesis protein CapA domain-containing protein n=2 Tax=Rhodonellum TaxID=336827 RepID=U5C719_9BACT|nr:MULTISPECIES: CapA family protein [Rhodonellum]ERM83992.1 hypothetical protein P872_01645 [Rhodonellum psychrophilum GCM71 = DSM 17998]SDZ06184.1 poly-gamma-glutamate synthesis protein (capsule biosynthesis protein) [Rhodonellum ikkaensis]
MVSIGFTGDFCPWERMEESFLKGDWDENMKSVRPFFLENDLNIIDLECPLTTVGNGIPKTGPHIKSLPQTTEILDWLNCKLVATANNHFRDYGPQGIKDTYRALNDAGISWFGSGLNAAEAAKIHRVQIQNLEFAFLNMTEHEWSTTEGPEPGCNPLDPIKAFGSIQKLKKEVDFVVVVLHGGHEHYELPSPRMKETYRFMIDAGADAVVAHHTHIISGHEVYQGKPIFYSLGNFCFDWKGLRNGTWNKGMILKLKFEKGKNPEFEYKFIKQNDENAGVYLLDAESSKPLEDNILKLNSIIADDDQLQNAFDTYSKQLESIMLTRIQPYKNKVLTALNRRNILPDIMGKGKQRLLKNLIQCESHREVLLNALNRKLS